MERAYWVYILANKRNGTLYVGMTSDLVGRIWAHHEGFGSVFTAQYGVTRLVYFERHDSSAAAAGREHSLKRWRRKWKLALIEEQNPSWRDLFEEIAQ